jgi:nucleoside-diphosphate-sugar epimerase
MRILITGNLGYVGPVLIRHLRETWPEAQLIGCDSGFFAAALTTAGAWPERHLDIQLYRDVRDLTAADLAGVTAVVHLAAVSNDPMGHRFERVTDAINHEASVRLARMARDQGVRHFVFASSCSVYGFAEGGARKETDPLNPLTAYARSKIATEQDLAALDLGEMRVTCLRFATACGFSERLRLDLVLNDFVACALANGEITVLSDGTPWRPLIAVKDMARAIAWAIERPAAQGGRFLAVNVGADEWNYQVRDLAEAVAAAIPGTRVSINTEAPPDRRSYRVDFGLFRELAPAHQPQETLAGTIRGLCDGLRAVGFADPAFRAGPFIRLKTLERWLAAGLLDEDLRWRRQAAFAGEKAA